MWYSFMFAFNGRWMFLKDVWITSKVLQTNACNLYNTLRVSAIFASSWFAEKWPASFQTFYINILELFLIVVAVEIWGFKS